MYNLLTMAYTATITSKRQLTIPAKLFKKAGLSHGDKVLMEEKDGKIILRSALSLVEELAGSVKIPKHLRGVDADEAIRIAKERYFANKKE